MPLTAHGKRMMSRLRDEYGKEKGTSVFYAMKNKGTMPGKVERKTALTGRVRGRR